MWHMYGYLRNGMLVDVGSRRYVTGQQLPYPIVEVEVSPADHDHPATHWGWVQTGGDAPSIIWPAEELFRCWFQSSPEDEERKGFGRTVRLSVRPVGRLATQ